MGADMEKLLKPIRRKDYSAPPNPREQEVLDSADYYQVYQHLGFNRKINIKCETIELAAEIALEVIHRTKKSCIIYAVRSKDGAQAFLKKVDPK
jgi:hypothetical protein